MFESLKRRRGADNTIELDQRMAAEQPSSAPKIPESTKSRYSIGHKGDEVTFYKGHKTSEVAFQLNRDAGRMTTKSDDVAIVRDMIGVAQAEGWKTVKVGGSRDFRREAWIEAASRDIEATGYKATDRDRQEAQKRQDRRPLTPDLETPRAVPANDIERTSSRVAGGKPPPERPDTTSVAPEIEKVAQLNQAVRRDEVRVERDKVSLAEDRTAGRADAVPWDEARLKRDEARLGADRARLSKSARTILTGIEARIDAEFKSLTGPQKTELKGFAAGVLAFREQEVGRLKDPGPWPRPSDRSRSDVGKSARVEPKLARPEEPERQLPARRREREMERGL